MTFHLVFDLDGTLLDSDEALVSPFLQLGVERDQITFGHVLADECARLGVSLTDYLAAYDTGQAQPFDGVPDLVSRLDAWAVCSNKDGSSGRAELDRLGWTPDVAYFADAFTGPKELGPVLEATGWRADEVIFVGDTGHDRASARDVGARFALAGWNPRTVEQVGDLVADHPLDILGMAEPTRSQVSPN
jgi:HAD superfamily hydrolase (TIGR01549 family)